MKNITHGLIGFYLMEINIKKKNQHSHDYSQILIVDILKQIYMKNLALISVYSMHVVVVQRVLIVVIIIEFQLLMNVTKLTIQRILSVEVDLPIIEKT